MTYLYDEVSVPNGIGRRTGMIDSSSQSAYYYGLPPENWST